MNLKKELVLGVKIGVMIFLAVYFAAFCSSISGLLKNSNLVEILTRDVKAVVILFYLKLILIFVLNGAVFGVFSALFWYFLNDAGIIDLKNINKKLIYVVSVIVALFFIIIRQMVYQPSFFDRYLNDKGGLLRDFQYWATENLSLDILDISFYLFAVIFILLILVFILKRNKNVVIAIVCISASLFFMTRKGKSNEGPNVLVLCVETLRPDHLSYNGYHRKTTPNIDLLAEEGASFDNAFVTIARTLPSVTSFLTGTYPKTHNITNIFPDAFDRRVAVPTLPRVLQKYGYETVAVGDYSAEMFGRVDYGFKKLLCPKGMSIDLIIERRIILDFIVFMSNFNNRFGAFFFPALEFIEGNDDPERLTTRLKKELARCVSSKKFFAFGFYSAPHIPFNAVYPYYKTYTDPLYRGKKKYSCRYDDITKIKDYVGRYEVSEYEKEHLKALYDGALKSVDDQIGDLVAYLKENGLFENTIIFVIGDHGEDFYENGTTLGHGIWFKGADNANRIPMIIHNPYLNEKGVRNSSLVRNIDLMPTVLDFLDLDMPESVEGVTLRPLATGEKDSLNLDIFCETGLWFDSKATFTGEEGKFLYPPLEELLTYEPGSRNTVILKYIFKEDTEKAKHRMYRDDNWKMVYIPPATYQLFNIKNDPESKDNLIDKEKEKFEELKKALLDWNTPYIEDK